MKKLISILLVLLVGLSFSVAAFADDSPNVKVTFSGNSQFSLPTEQPLISTIPVNSSNPTNANISFGDPVRGTNFNGYTVPITLPTYTHPGLYEYHITQNSGKAQGVAYDADPIVFVVLVKSGTNEQGEPIIITQSGIKKGADGTKKADFENSFSFGSLRVKNTVEINNGNQDQEFTIGVIFTVPQNEDDTTVQNTITYQIKDEDGTTVTTDTEIPPTSWSEGKLCSVSIKLKPGQSVTFSNVPKDVSYSVVQEDLTGYDSPTYTGKSGSIDANSVAEAEVKNNISSNLITGVFFNNAVYVAVLAIAVAGLVLLCIRSVRKNGKDTF